MYFNAQNDTVEGTNCVLGATQNRPLHPFDIKLDCHARLSPTAKHRRQRGNFDIASRIRLQVHRIGTARIVFRFDQPPSTFEIGDGQLQKFHLCGIYVLQVGL